MATNVYNFEVIRGDSLPMKLRYLAAGTPVDLSGSNALLVFKWAAGSLTLESPADITLGADGTIVAQVPGIETQNWPHGPNTAFQLRLTDSLGGELTLLQGRVDVLRSAIEEAMPDA